jgi:transcriptional regulator with XRE-family HTH domain
MSEVIHCPDAHESMWEALGDKENRTAFAEEHNGDFLAAQIFALRTLEDWSQATLAKKAGVTQPMISEWEKSCEGVRLSSLHKVAAAFDIALLVKFVPFSQLAREAIETRSDLPIPSFDDDSRQAIGFGSVRVMPAESSRRQKGQSGDYLRNIPQLMTGDSGVAIAR